MLYAASFASNEFSFMVTLIEMGLGFEALLLEAYSSPVVAGRKNKI
jgi:hypothetical protein